MITRHARRAYQIVRPHAPQFIRYLLSGGTAAFLELASYQVMLVAGMHYALAAPVSGGVGLLSAFALHKYLVFKQHEKTGRQVVRYIILQTFNFFAQWGLVVLFVEGFGVHAIIAKILGIGCTVLWNFFLYKLFVYAK